MDNIYVFIDVFDFCMEILKMEFNLYGYTLSLWKIGVWGVLASVLLDFAMYMLFSD